MKAKSPEVHIDVNARMTANGYLLVDGTISDLARLGLTPEQAAGRSFTFNGGDDEHDGKPADVMFDGTIEKDNEFGYLAVADSRGIYWRAKK